MAETLAQRAALRCERPRRQEEAPRRSFRTDGCTLWPDGTWRDCCIEHDITYWCGGSRAERLEADRQLRSCATERVGGWRGETLGALLQAGTFVGGAPWLPTPWRWGYGRSFPSGYSRGEATSSQDMQNGQ